MLTLCMDTSHKYMGIALLDGETIIDQKSMDCFKKQSELLLVEVDAMLKKNGFTPKDIKAICISKGPGSYTGVRIAMTVAKVLGALEPIDVYTLSTLRLYSAGQKGMTLLDARSGRAYCGDYRTEDGKESILTLEELQAMDLSDVKLFADGHLLGKEDRFLPIGECFGKNRASWEKVENIHALIPEYFKGIEGYQKQA